MPSIRPRHFLALMPLALAACVSTHQSAALTALPADLAAGGHIDKIDFTNDTAVKVSDHFDQTFTSHVQAKLDGCAKGARPLVLKASLTRLSRSNSAMTILTGSARNKVRGEAQLVDERTGQVVGDYKIGETVYGARLATIQMLQPEKQLADAFGAEVCRQAFHGAS